MGNTLSGPNDGLQAFVYDPWLEFTKIELPLIQSDRFQPNVLSQQLSREIKGMAVELDVATTLDPPHLIQIGIVQLGKLVRVRSR
jgi:hypothetical protein